MDTSRFEYLFHAYLHKTATDAEREEFFAMVRQPGAGKWLREFGERYPVPETPLYTLDEEAGGQIITAIRKGSRRPARKLNLWRMAAAAAAILVVAAVGIYRWTDKPAQQEIVIHPGTNKATLTLSDGSIISLDSAANRVIAQGIRQEGNRLAYDKQEGAVTYNLLKIPRGGQFQLLLPDGTKVWLNAASSLRYPTVFKGTERRVEVAGEAYFEVAENASMPFRVDVNSQVTVEVLGTQFNINAYADEQSIYTTLLQGKVRVSGVVLQPGQQAVLSTGQPVRISQPNVSAVTAWKDGMFQFENETLGVVMRQIARWYDVEVVYEAGAPVNEVFHGKMQRNLQLSQVLKGLSRIGVHFRVEQGKRLIVMKQ